MGNLMDEEAIRYAVDRVVLDQEKAEPGSVIDVIAKRVRDQLGIEIKA